MGERWRTILAAVLARRDRWLPIALVAVGLFAVNGASRLITWKGGIVKEDQQMRIGFIAVAAVGVLLVAASAWWSYRYPLGRMIADLGLAVLIACAASLIIGPYLGGSRPFKGGLEFVVLQALLFLGLGAVGMFLGFIGVVAFGADWKSRGLKEYERSYRSRPHRPVRG